jgi:hypothetical protein
MYIIVGDPNLEVSKIQSCSNPSFAILISSSPYLVDRPPVLYHSLLQISTIILDRTSNEFPNTLVYPYIISDFYKSFAIIFCQHMDVRYPALSVCISDAHIRPIGAISDGTLHNLRWWISTITSDEKATSFLTLSYAPMLFRIFMSLFLWHSAIYLKL